MGRGKAKEGYTINQRKGIPAVHPMALAGARRTLKLNSQATKTQIKQAYRREIMRCHPDFHVHSTFIERDRMKDHWNRVQKAYFILINYDSPAQKIRYTGAYSVARRSRALARLGDVRCYFPWQTALNEWKQQIADILNEWRTHP